jgi:hypothetical protein
MVSWQLPLGCHRPTLDERRSIGGRGADADPPHNTLLPSSQPPLAASCLIHELVCPHHEFQTLSILIYRYTDLLQCPKKVIYQCTSNKGIDL